MTEQNPKPAPAGRIRHCWNCGADMGFIEDRNWDRRDTCESLECSRAARDADAAEREEAHDRVDRDFDGRW